MWNRLTFLIAFTLIALTTFSKGKKDFTAVFYNVENLFDTINDPDKLDDDFTPEGELKYNSERYVQKLDKLSKVLASINKENLPEIIGLCEIENRSVLNDLIKTDNLKKGKYGIVQFESPDKRGIDCALLYRKGQFRILKQDTIGIHFTWDKEFKTRDILYVQGLAGKKDTLNVFVNHWPSRRGGEEVSEKNRIFVAEQLKLAINTLQEKNPEAKIIIMGDFNDEPKNKSVTEALGAGNCKNTSDPKALYNFMYDIQEQGLGSYNYRGNWNMLDNLIVSNSLFTSKKGLSTKHDAGKIFTEEWICFKNKNGVLIPNRTYAGPKYLGGYSDHFPVFFHMEY